MSLLFLNYIGFSDSFFSIYALTPLFLIGLRVIFRGCLKSVPLKLTHRCCGRIVCLAHYIKMKSSTKFDSQKVFFFLNSIVASPYKKSKDLRYTKHLNSD